MNKDLKEQLHKDLDRPRPRPLMFVGWRNGERVYVRKRSLSYFQLLKKYPPPRNWAKILKPPHHVLAKKHHLVNRENDYVWGYIMAGCGIAIFTVITILYLYLFWRAYG